jgi:hypothetical protein
MRMFMSLTQALCTPLSVLLALSTFADGRLKAVWGSAALISVKLATAMS